MSVALRAFTIGLTAFLTVVDLFATQAILPSLTAAYGVTPAAMGFAVMQHHRHGDRGLAVGLFGRSIDRRPRHLVSLAVLSVRRCCWPPCRRCRCSPCCGSRRAFACRPPLRSPSPISASIRVRPTRRRLCRLHHGQCRLQPVRPPAGRWRGRPFRLAPFLRVRGPQSVGRDPRLVHRRAHRQGRKQT